MLAALLLFGRYHERSDDSTMSSSKPNKIVRVSRAEAKNKRGQTDWERVDATTDAEIAAWQVEKGLTDEQIDVTSARVVVPQTTVVPVIGGVTALAEMGNLVI